MIGLQRLADYLVERCSRDYDVVVAVTGDEGCQPAGSKILMSDGEWKNIEDIKIGDRVLSPQKDGSYIFANVINLFRWFSKKTYDIYSYNRKLYSCSYNHEIPVYDTLLKGIIDIEANKLGVKECHYTINNKFKVIPFHLERRKGKEVYGFTLDSESHWYITDNFMVTKNCGKSTLAIQLSRRIGNFILSRNCLFSPNANTIKQRIRELPKFSPVILDEAIKVFYKLKWHDRIQILLNQFYTLCRQENKISIICIPRFTDLNEYFRNHRILVWIHVLYRTKKNATAIVFIKDKNPLIHDVWHVDELERVFKKVPFNKLSPHSQIRMLSRNKCFIGIVKFRDLKLSMANRYKNLKAKYKYDYEDEAMPESEKVKKMKAQWVMGVLCLRKYLGWSGTKIAKAMEVSPNVVRKVLADNAERIANLKEILNLQDRSKENLAKIEAKKQEFAQALKGGKNETQKV